MLVPDQLPPAGVAVSVTGIGWLHKFWSAPALTVKVEFITVIGIIILSLHP